MEGGHRRLEKVSRIQVVVAQKFEERSVKLVGTGLGDDADNRSRQASELGVKVAGEQTELAHGVGIGRFVSTVAAQIIVEAAIEQKIAWPGAAAIGGNEIDLIVAGGDGGCLGYAGKNGHESVNVAPVEREILDALAVDGAAHLGLTRIDQRAIVPDMDLLRDGADFERQIDSRVLIDT